MKRHAAFPYEENAPRLNHVFAEFIEQHVAETTAENDAQYAVEQYIVEILNRQRRMRPRPNRVTPDCPDQRKTDEIHQAIPAHGEWAEMDRNRIKLRMDEH